jgi:hypothetical protein
VAWGMGFRAGLGEKDNLVHRGLRVRWRPVRLAGRQDIEGDRCMVSEERGVSPGARRASKWSCRRWSLSRYRVFTVSFPSRIPSVPLYIFPSVLYMPAVH